MPGGTYTLAFTLPLIPPGDAALLRVGDAIEVRLKDGSLRCRCRTTPASELIDLQLSQGREPTADLREGLLTLQHPASTGRYELRLTPAHIQLLRDGELLDEEWPTGPLRLNTPGAIEPIAPEVSSVTFVESAKIVTWPAEKQPALTQYWAPDGHDCWAGDAMLSSDGERLHLFWLFDRHRGNSKYGCGAHQFAHASSADLRKWTHHPLAFPVTETWESTIGTGCMVHRNSGDDRYFLFGNIITERLGRLSERHPSGLYLATSRDGLAFQKRGFTGMSGEPGIVCVDGIYHAVSSSRHADGVWRTSRYTSQDLLHWALAEADFLPPPSWPCTREVFSSECFCWFRFGDWWYIIGGRTGFWKSRELLGPYQRPRWDIYDGLMVPQAAVHNGRCILAGWLPIDRSGFAGHLVFRELLQTPTGELETRRLPELAAPGERLAMRVKPGPRGRPYGLRIGGRLNDDLGVELRFDPTRRTAQWATPVLSGQPTHLLGMPFDGEDFEILEVPGLGNGVDVELVICRDAKSGTTIIDAQFNGRTMITRRKRFTPGQLHPLG